MADSQSFTNGDGSYSHSHSPSQLDDRSVPPLGMTGSQFREAATSVINEIEHYYTHLPDRPVLPSISPGYLRPLLPASPPQHGEPWANIAQDIETKILPGVTHWQHPKFMAFFPASSTYPGILGEMWSAALTAPAFNWICSPVVTELETVVLDWLAQTLALPETFHSRGTGGGVIQGSASEAIVTVMIAARERFVRRQIEREGLTDPEAIEDRACALRADLVALASDQAHSSSQKAATIAGTRFRSIPTAPRDAYALTGASLRAKISELEARGLKPYYLTVSIGATGTCAVDEFASIAAVAAEHPDLWIHVDAAYAGAAMVLPEHQHLSAAVAFADSYNVNMHKWLLTNFDASCLFVRRRADLTAALGITPAYLRNQYTESGLVTDYRDWQIPLGRRFRALKIWFVLRTWGVEGLRAHVRHHIRLGERFAEWVRGRPDLFRLLAPPAFALTVVTVNWRADGEGTGTEEGEEEVVRGNEITKEVFEAIEAKEEFFLTSTVVGGVYAIRVVSANPLAEERYVRELFDQMIAVAKEVRGRRGLRKGT